MRQLLPDSFLFDERVLNQDLDVSIPDVRLKRLTY